MDNENHMKNASKSFSKGARNAGEHASHGRVLDAVGSAFEGTATAATELAKSASQRVAHLVDSNADDQ